MRIKNICCKGSSVLIIGKYVIWQDITITGHLEWTGFFVTKDRLSKKVPDSNVTQVGGWGNA